MATPRRGAYDVSLTHIVWKVDCISGGLFFQREACSVTGLSVSDGLDAFQSSVFFSLCRVCGRCTQIRSPVNTDIDSSRFHDF